MALDGKWVGVPKVELHCHLDGSLSPAFVSERLGRQVDAGELQVDEGCRSLAEYLERFDLPVSCLQDAEGLAGAGYDLIRTAARDNVCYLEVRFAPALSAHDGFTCADAIAALLAGLARGERDFGVRSNAIVCAMRGHSFERNLGMLEAARGFLGAGVCAADLAGDEAAYPMEGYRGLFKIVRGWGMPFTIHAGETGCARNIEVALEVGACRIGHGIAMAGRSDLQQRCRRDRIGIELCPKSNLQTCAVAHPQDYPLREFLDAGLLVTLNTDNRTVSADSMTRECAFVQEAFGATDAQVARMLMNAIEVSFADGRTKGELARKLEGALRERGIALS